MNAHLSCQPDRILPTSKRSFGYSGNGPKAFSQDLISTAMINTLLTEGEVAQSYQFDLGDDICLGSSAAQDDNLQASACDLYLIAGGTVRLLANNDRLQKTVSVACLGPGEAFGSDRIFCAHPLPYWAKAAAPCQLVRVSYDAIQRVLSRWPAVLGHLQRQIQLRSQLAFFKQCTLLGAVPSATLSYRLLPYLVEQPFQPGSTLAQYPFTPGEYLWLRQGSLINPAAAEWSARVGDGWVYSAPLGDWVAQTEGLIYRLIGTTPEWDDLSP